jgi:hypothetical protein
MRQLFDKTEEIRMSIDPVDGPFERAEAATGRGLPHRRGFYLRMIRNKNKNESQNADPYAANAARGARLRSPFINGVPTIRKNVSCDPQFPLTGPRTPTHPSNRGPVILSLRHSVLRVRGVLRDRACATRRADFRRRRAVGGTHHSERAGAARRTSSCTPSTAAFGRPK